MTDLEATLRRIIREEITTALADHLPAPANRAEFETTEEAAERIGLSASTLEQYRRAGEGPPFVKTGRRIMYQVADVEAWMLSNRKGANPRP